MTEVASSLQDTSATIHILRVVRQSNLTKNWYLLLLYIALLHNLFIILIFSAARKDDTSVFENNPIEIL